MSSPSVANTGTPFVFASSRRQSAYGDGVAVVVRDIESTFKGLKGTSLLIVGLDENTRYASKRGVRRGMPFADERYHWFIYNCFLCALQEGQPP